MKLIRKIKKYFNRISKSKNLKNNFNLNFIKWFGGLTNFKSGANFS